jgi:hypothetical protein
MAVAGVRSDARGRAGSPIIAHCVRASMHAGLRVLAVAAVAVRAGAPIPVDAAPQALQVGPGRAIATIAQAARVARDGDVVEIDAGDYVDDVASWSQSDIVIRAVDGVARLSAPNASAEGKAIWVIKGDNVVVEGIAFADQRVPDRNGAGIRHEGGRLTVRRCLFERNEMGILTGGGERSELVVETSEFRHNAVAGEYRPGDRIGHQIYAGPMARFTLRESFVHGGAYGHLVKSRARENLVYNNMLADDADGRASYELEFPNGGVAFVFGNVIAQSEQTDNAVVVSFGAEGYRWPEDELYLVNNTLVDRLPSGGTFVRVHRGPATLVAWNNVLVGKGLSGLDGAQGARNVRAQRTDFAAPDRGDYRLRRRSKLAGSAVDPGSARGVALRPAREYVHPTSSRAVQAGRYSPGALQTLAP